LHFDLTDIRLLIAIADAGSLSRAAIEFPIALSAASNRLRHFEQRCGLILFARSAGGVTATPAGRIVLDHARRLLAEVGQMQDSIESLTGKRRIQVRLAATTVVNNTYLPAALGPFLADFPEVDLHLEEKNSKDVLEAVLAHEVEIGILDGGTFQADVVSLPFRHDRLVLLTPLEHALASHSHCLLRDALGHAFIGLPSDRAMQRFMEEIALQLAKPMKIRVRAPSFFAQVQLVAQGAGIAVLPEEMARHHAREFPAKIVTLDDAWASRELRICVRSLDRLSVQAQQLLGYLGRHVQP
jgi:DNA-binding transcriptional LysR family regulator